MNYIQTLQSNSLTQIGPVHGVKSCKRAVWEIAGVKVGWTLDENSLSETCKDESCIQQ